MSISIANLSKSFRLYDRPLHRLEEWLTLGRCCRHRTFWALRDVNLNVPKGISMGIVGPNGAGKSTLLKIVTGTLFPTEGEARVEGRVAALLELGTGFHPEFTGRLNIYLNGKMLGLSDEEIAERFDEIVRFSELGEFIDQPIRTYSSGMTMRLGFSIASCVDPDVLIVDEALSVGDAHFSQKCIRRIREFRRQGVTILFVSHDPAAILTLCDRAVLLEAGRIESEGRPEEVLDFYNARIAHREGGAPGLVFVPGAGAMGTLRSGNFRAMIASVRMLDASGRPCEVFTNGDRAVLAVRIVFLDDVKDPTVGILIRNRLGIDVFGANTAGLGRPLGDFRAGQETEVRFEFALNLGPDEYSVTAAVHRDETHVAGNYDWVDKAGRFKVAPAGFRFVGLARLTPAVVHSPPCALRGDVQEVLDAAFGSVPDSLGLDASDDAFFVEGWRAVQDERGAVRWRECPGEGRFVLRPRAPRISIRFDPSPETENRYPSLLWMDGEAVGRAARDAGEAVYELPAHIAGRTRVFRLRRQEPEGNGPAGPRAFRLASIRSIEENRA